MEIPPLHRIIKWLGLLWLYFWVTTSCVTVILLPLGYSITSIARSGNFYQVGEIISGMLGMLNCIAPIAT